LNYIVDTPLGDLLGVKGYAPDIPIYIASLFLKQAYE